MKTLGLIAGMTWQSSIEYYRILNEEVARRLGGLHSVSCILHSVDFDPYDKMMIAGEWEAISARVVPIAQELEAAGADYLMICTNTMHKLVPAIERAVSTPILHIADAAGEAIVGQGLTKVGLLGTKFTMEEDFYRGRLKAKFGIEVIIPGQDDRTEVNRVIFEELGIGQLLPASKQRYLEIIHKLQAQGAQGIVLGCTEIPLLIHQKDVEIPVFDTTTLHALYAVQRALE